MLVIDVVSPKHLPGGSWVSGCLGCCVSVWLHFPRPLNHPLAPVGTLWSVTLYYWTGGRGRIEQLGRRIWTRLWRTELLNFWPRRELGMVYLDFPINDWHSSCKSRKVQLLSSVEEWLDSLLSSALGRGWLLRIHLISFLTTSCWSSGLWPYGLLWQYRCLTQEILSNEASRHVPTCLPHTPQRSPLLPVVVTVCRLPTHALSVAPMSSAY